jgi:hypothetical protein
MTFAVLGSCGPLMQAGNAPYVQFLVDAGRSGIAVGVDNGFANVPAGLSDWFKAPVTTLYQTIWSGFIRQAYAADPTFNTLLTQ